MKVSFERLNGYQWVEYDEDLYTISDEILKNPPQNIYDGQCSEIYAPNFLDSVKMSDYKETIFSLCKKLEHGGKIILGGIDLIELMKNVQNYTINVEEFNTIVYNESRQGVFTLNDTVENLIEIGLKIQRKQLNGYHFLVEAIRL